MYGSMRQPITNEEYRRLAGECTRCVYYDYEEAKFTVNCYQCNRYWGDMFEDRDGLQVGSTMPIPIDPPEYAYSAPNLKI